jgi:hypothetical protein
MEEQSRLLNADFVARVQVEVGPSALLTNATACILVGRAAVNLDSARLMDLALLTLRQKQVLLFLGRVVGESLAALCSCLLAENIVGAEWNIGWLSGTEAARLDV